MPIDPLAIFLKPNRSNPKHSGSFLTFGAINIALDNKDPPPPKSRPYNRNNPPHQIHRSRDDNPAMTQTTNIPQRAATLLAQLPLNEQQNILAIVETTLTRYQITQPRELEKPKPTMAELLDELDQIQKDNPIEPEPTVRIDRPNPLFDED
jgi:hypothetical protein